MLIREACAQDAQALAEVLKEIGWFEPFSQLSFDTARDQVRARIERCQEDNSHLILVAEAPDQTVLAYAAVHWIPYLFLNGPEGYVSELFVRPAARGQELGRRLLKAIENEARRRGCARLSLINLRHRESYQRQFYVKAGWLERAEAANFIYKIS
jgi:GNAT superfamily N-acetyltransferase